MQATASMSAGPSHLHLAVLGFCDVTEANDAASRQLPSAPVKEQVGGEEAVAMGHDLGHGAGERHPFFAAGRQQLDRIREQFEAQEAEKPTCVQGGDQIPRTQWCKTLISWVSITRIQ